MIETFAALLLAHVLADFVLQSDGMAEGKQKRRPLALLLHGLVVLATATVAVAPRDPGAFVALAILAAVHIAIDLGKSLAPADRLSAFLADQASHVLSLAAFAAVLPGLWPDGMLGAFAPLPGLMALTAGLILATQAGGYAVGLLIGPFARALDAEDSAAPAVVGLPNGGRMIGLLERGLIFLFILVGQPSAVGFLIAAKSVLRFETASREHKVAEYVIIGTLASFGWALLAAYATLALLDHLPALGILPPSH